MTLSLERALVGDIETLPNVFTLNVQGLYDSTDMLFEISDQGRDDRQQLIAWFYHWQDTQTPLIGFNIVAFDYEVLHYIYQNPYVSVEDIYAYAMDIIRSNNRFGGVYPSDRFLPIIDLYKLWHMDNRAKSTSLKALQVSMRSESVMEMPLPFDQPLTRAQIDQYLIPYNRHDVAETKKFAHISMDAIKFRIGLMDTLKGDVPNWNDTKIGSKILEQRLGIDKYAGTTRRDTIPLNDIIFPYIRFDHPEFNRILNWMRGQTLAADELTESIQTKGVFTGVKATVGGLDFHFGTGGIHGSVSAQRFVEDDRIICDIDVAALYPSIAIVNGLYPEHLGTRFVEEYAKLPVERGKYAKGTVQNAAFKLAANGTYGNSNNAYSVFYDPRFTMQITINGQLMLCMLAERLLMVPSLEIIQINTDGITYRIHRVMAPIAERVRSEWETLTKLKLEEARYRRMWIRDVNNYIAETTDGKLKLKGAYWYPKNFPDDITNASPPAWHKDFSNVVATKAAVDHMVNGTDIERFIYSHRDPFDFMLRAKVDRSSRLKLGGREMQRIMRYYVAVNGAELKKISPPVKGARVGDWKRRNGISDQLWHDVTQEVGPGVWDARIHTANKSKYVIREMAIESGFKVADCSVAADFDFSNVDYAWYVDQARRLVIP